MGYVKSGSPGAWHVAWVDGSWAGLDQQPFFLVGQLSNGPGSGCGHAVTVVCGALALCAVQSHWDAEELLCPLAPSLVGT